MELKITPSGQTIVKPTALGPGANTDTKLLIYGLFQKGRVLAQDGVRETPSIPDVASPDRRYLQTTASPITIGCRSYIYNGVNNLQAHYRWYVTDCF